MDFRLGTLIVALSVVLALVPGSCCTRRAGLLVVRTRTIDGAVLAILSGGLLLLALIVPGAAGLTLPPIGSDPADTVSRACSRR